MPMLNHARPVLFGAIALAVAGLAADTPTQTIEARGLTFKAPKAWKSSPPRSSMRAAQLAVEPVQGDPEPAELAVFVFPGSAGTVEANIERWRSQFEDKDGKTPKAVTEKRRGKNTDVTFVEISGRYVAPLQPGSPQKFNKPDFRLLGAIVDTRQAAYFLKMVGPEKTMKSAKSAFDDLIASIQVEDK